MDIIRAWKDPEYRESLSELEFAALPEHPAGMIELSDADLGGVVGGITPWTPSIIVALTALVCPDGTGTGTGTGEGHCECHCHCNSMAPASIFVATGVFDDDTVITQEEYDAMQETLETWLNDPTLSAEQVEDIVELTEGLQEHLPPNEWEALMHSVHVMQETGSLTSEQLEGLVEFAEEISAE